MKIKYFNDSDTALIEFTDVTVAETREISEDVTVDLDKEGNLVNLTIEHASSHASLPEMEFEEV